MCKKLYIVLIGDKCSTRFKTSIHVCEEMSTNHTNVSNGSVVDEKLTGEVTSGWVEACCLCSHEQRRLECADWHHLCR